MYINTEYPCVGSCCRMSNDSKHRQETKYQQYAKPKKIAEKLNSDDNLPDVIQKKATS